MTEDPNTHDGSTLIEISAEDFAALGSDAIGYIRRMSSSELQQRFAQVGDLPLDRDLFAVFRGDGTPIALANDPQAALENMHKNNLMQVALH